MLSSVWARERWDLQYALGKWRCLSDLQEQAHHSVLAGYVLRLKPNGSVLDVGCGDGRLARSLHTNKCHRYVGIDLSIVAIQRAQYAAPAENFSFVATDAANYAPLDRFDAIVWDESLYYFDEPLCVLLHYEKFLTPGGMFMTSMFKTSATDAILCSVKTRYVVVDETIVWNRKHTWTVSVFSTSA